MKQFKSSIAIIFSACLFFACTGKGSSENKSDATDAKTSSDTKAASTDLNLTGKDGRFSYTINGERVETVSNVQNANLLINEVSNDKADGLLKIEVTCSGINVFDFEIANSGTTSITSYQPSFSEKAKGATYMDGKTSRNLYAHSATITITSIDDSRVKGTFSGKFFADKSDGGATADVTDGSFNLPFMKF
ncbi:MAG TPA: hypothetical protein VGI82_09320 [Chitinophagaceae bacterium]|jgi:hypothetical protein